MFTQPVALSMSVATPPVMTHSILRFTFSM